MREQGPIRVEVHHVKKLACREDLFERGIWVNYAFILGFVGGTQVFGAALRPLNKEPHATLTDRWRIALNRITRYLEDMYGDNTAYGEPRITLAEEADRVRHERKVQGRTYKRKMERVLLEVDAWTKRPPTVPDTYYERADTAIR